MLSAIAELEKPIRIIFDQLHYSIQQNIYKTLLGDDLSGRIPTLLLRKIINHIYLEKEHCKIKTFFIVGGYVAQSIEDAQRNAIYAHLRKIRKAIRDRLLYVTDEIASGNSLMSIAEILYENNISFDVAAINIHNRLLIRVLRRFLSNYDANLFVGTIKEESLRIHGDRYYCGLYRSKSEVSALSKVAKISISNEKNIIKSAIINARIDINGLANQLITHYRNHEDP